MFPNFFCLGLVKVENRRFFKQLTALYGIGFDEKDYDAAVPVIYRNIMHSMEELVRASEQLPKTWPDECKDCVITNPTSRASADYILKLGYEDGKISPEMIKNVKQLWKDPAILRCYARRARVQLYDCAKYFLDKIDVVTKEPYRPSYEDLLNMRSRTTGIVDNEFRMGTEKFRMVDVGGQRNERKKWIHCFESVTAIIFVAAISEYDQKLFEDETVDRTKETLTLFENTLNNRTFNNVTLVLFLNKADVFREKIKNHPLGDIFPEYKGGADYELAIEFMRSLFEKVNYKKRTYFTHITCATSTQNVEQIFPAVYNEVLQHQNLLKAGPV